MKSMRSRGENFSGLMARRRSRACTRSSGAALSRNPRDTPGRRSDPPRRPAAALSAPRPRRRSRPQTDAGCRGRGHGRADRANRRQSRPAVHARNTMSATATRYIPAMVALDRRLAHELENEPWGPLVQCRPMVEPRVIPREEHTLSRRDIDPDALRFSTDSVRAITSPISSAAAYATCCSDDGRKTSTSGHRPTLPGQKTVPELLDHRPAIPSCARQVRPEGRSRWRPSAARCSRVRRSRRTACRLPITTRRTTGLPTGRRPHFLHRDNTFGTPEEDAFRRDFTINALFYDIATFSVIDYVGGLDDLRAGVVRSIGDPRVRFQEDPGPHAPRRGARGAARLHDRSADPFGDRASSATKSRAVRRRGCSRSTTRFFEPGRRRRHFAAWPTSACSNRFPKNFIAAQPKPLWQSLAAVDAYRQKFTATPETLTNPVLLGSLLVPLGLSPQMGRPAYVESASGRRRPAIPRMGSLPLARRDVERLRQILGLQRRLRDLGANVRRSGR